MLALQKSLLEQSDITPVLLNFDFQQNRDGELFVQNAPTLDLSKAVGMDFSGLTVEEILEEESEDEVQ